MNEEANVGNVEAQPVSKSNGKWQSNVGKSTSPHGAEEMQTQVLDSAKKAYSSVIENASGAFKQFNLSGANRVVRQYPVQAALGALAIGFVLGAAISRRGE